MRIWEAVIQDEFQDAFFQFNNCLTRLDLDGRKSQDRDEKTFFELVTKKHNDTEWCPQSQPVFGFYTRLKESHLLPLHAEYTIKDVCKIYTSMKKGNFNKMINNYKTSGNGSLKLQGLHTHCDNKNSKSNNDSHKEVFIDNNHKTSVLVRCTMVISGHWQK
jgi:hypothetical protein